MPTWSSSTSPRPSSRAPASTPTRLRADNPALVHAWMPPHAPRGPVADLPADELLLWAWTGLASQQPGATSDHPVASVVPIITYEQGALGATAIAAALIERATRGIAAVAHGVGAARGERDEHLDPDRPARHLPALRREQGRHRRVAPVPHVPVPRRGVGVRLRAHAVVLLQAARGARPHGDHAAAGGRGRVRPVRAAAGPGHREREVRRAHGRARLRRVGAAVRRARRAVRAGADARGVGRQRDRRRQRPPAAGARRRRHDGSGAPRGALRHPWFPGARSRTWRRVGVAPNREAGWVDAAARRCARGRRDQVPRRSVRVPRAPGSRRPRREGRPAGGRGVPHRGRGVVLRAEPRQGPGLHRPQGRRPGATRSPRSSTGPTRWWRT